jgi:hypothetical protein
VADGRAGLLTGSGALRDVRPLDDVFGVRSVAKLDGFARAPATAKVDFAGAGVEIRVLEPKLSAVAGRALRTVGGMPLFVSNAFGKGHALLMNVPFAAFNQLRKDDHQGMFLEPLSGALARVGVKPYATLATADGPARSIEQTLFVDGRLRYLALQQDILRRDLPEQAIAVTIEKPAYVYDVRAGELLSDGPTARWRTTLSRGTPRLFALMPHRVTGLDVELSVRGAKAAAGARPGDTVEVAVTVETDGAEPRYHAVRLDVFAPGSDSPHREYSQNVACQGGKGRATIPLALNDATGQWRLRLRDAATGAVVDRTLAVGGR